MASAPRRQPALPMPALLTRHRVWLALLVLLLLPFLVPIPPSLRRDILASDLGDRLHVVLFGGLTLALYWRGPLRGRLVPSALVAAAAGGGIEGVQELVGRSALWHDFELDLVGIGIAVGLVLWRGHGRRAGLLLVVALVALTLYQLRFTPVRMQAAADARVRFPVLADFEDERALVLVREVYGARLDLVPGRDGQALRLRGQPPAAWPGFSLHHLPHDWTAYDSVLVDVRLATATVDTVHFGVRLDDFLGRRDGDWLHEGFPATAAWRTFALAFNGETMHWGSRTFDAGDVYAVTVFLVTPPDTITLEIDNVRLR